MRKVLSVLLTLGLTLGSGVTNVFASDTLTGVKEVIPSYFYSLILKEDGTLYATGQNNNGQLGLGDTENRTTFTKVPITDVKQAAPAAYHTFVLKEDGTVWATGLNSNGQLGLGDTETRTTFTKIDITNVKKISASGNQTFILKEDGTLWATGRNGVGQLGLGDTDSRTEFTKVDVSGVKDVVADDQHTFILKEDGTVWSTGYNTRGQLGLGDTTTRTSFTKVNITNVKEIVLGAWSSAVIKEDGTLWMAGSNYSGQLGFGDNTDRYVFTKLSITGVKELVSGTEHNILLKEDGTIWVSGGNYYGLLGLGDTENRTTFTKVDIADVKQVLGGHLHTMLLKEDGTVWSTGYNKQGQLGLGDTEDRLTFTQVFSSIGDSLPTTELPKISTINQVVNGGNVAISVGVVGDISDLEYGLNAGDYQESNEFDITESGEYTVSIKEKSEVEILDEVTVNVDIDSVEDTLNILNTESKLLVGNSLQLKTETIKVAKEMGISLFNTEELVYESSNPKVASVDENGKVKALKQGNATISVMLGDLEATLDLEVLPITNAVDGNGDIIINGEIQALVMSLTVPQAVDFVINPNTRVEDETFISPKFYITNNSALDIGVTVEKLTVAEDSDYKFTDVAKDAFTEEGWYRLSPTNSMKYLALRIVPQDNTEWVNSDINECQAIDTNVKLGIIPSYKSTTLKLEANHGTALQPVTCKYNTVFVFEIDNLVE